MPFHALAARPAPWDVMLRQIRRQAEGLDPALVLYFASCALQGGQVAEGMAEAFPGARTIGCSAQSEYTNAGFTDGGLAALVFGRDVLENVAVALLPGLPDRPAAKAEAACALLTEGIGDEKALFSPERYVGILLNDGLSASEEVIMERLGDLSTVDFIGGSSSDKFSFDRAWIGFDGGAYAGTGLAALLRPSVPWAVGKTQSWQAWDGPPLTPTKVDMAKRRVFEFDGVAALDRYIGLLGYTRENFDGDYCFQHHPVGLWAGDELYVRHPARANPDGSMDFFCQLREGQPLSILSSTPILRDTSDRLAAFREEVGGELRAVVDFFCSQRYGSLDETRELRQYAGLFPETQRAGFATYGEQWIGHMNCTSAMLAFGA